jgi:hypothetical protein
VFYAVIRQKITRTFANPVEMTCRFYLTVAINVQYFYDMQKKMPNAAVA